MGYLLGLYKKDSESYSGSLSILKSKKDGRVAMAPEGSFSGFSHERKPDKSSKSQVVLNGYDA